MKKKLFLLVALIGTFTFAGCGRSDKFELSDGTTQKESFGEEKVENGGIFDFDSTTIDAEDPESDRFALVDHNYHAYNGGAVDILVDQRTRVQYLYYKSGLAVLLDENGAPLLYEGEVFYHAE